MLEQTAHLTGMSQDFMFNIQSGYLKGFSQYRAYGINDTCLIGQDNFVWDGGDEYIYPTINEEMFIASVNAGDTSVQVKISGLIEENGEWNERTNTVTLTGTTYLSVGNFIRINRLEVVGTTEPLGDIELHNTATPIDDTTLKGKIVHDNNTSLMAMYTIPSGKTAFIYRLFRSVKKNQDADFDYQVRPYGQVFKTTGIVGTFEESKQEEIAFEPVPEKSDIRTVVTTLTNNTEARASIHMIVVDNDKLDLARIESFN